MSSETQFKVGDKVHRKSEAWTVKAVIGKELYLTRTRGEGLGGHGVQVVASEVELVPEPAAPVADDTLVISGLRTGGANGGTYFGSDDGGRVIKALHQRWPGVEFVLKASVPEKDSGASPQASSASCAPAAPTTTTPAPAPEFKVGDRVKLKIDGSEWVVDRLFDVNNNGVPRSVGIKRRYKGEWEELSVANPGDLVLLPPAPESQPAQPPVSPRPFAPGDVVRLKSGGPLMTVSEVGTVAVCCDWFASPDYSNVVRETFKPEVLKHHQ